ncbi:metalloregulator ArsR/SmtB family transcription factor [Candidatus Micrarchaeota archaeon]|nr:metalloregulator ArsR/SmtB family transcription factor [Candidatus Micrarchaeota archaeon]
MQVFKALSCDSKIQILEILLKDSKACNKSLSAKLKLDSSTVSRHLKELRTAKLISMQKKGKNIQCIVLNSKKVKLLLNTAKELEKRR